jgi:hypothetical protein
MVRLFWGLPAVCLFLGAAAPKPPLGYYYAACGRQAILGLPPQTPFRFLKKAKAKTFKLKAGRVHDRVCHTVPAHAGTLKGGEVKKTRGLKRRLKRRRRINYEKNYS